MELWDDGPATDKALSYSAKARGARRAGWAGQARLSIESIIARRTRRTLQRGHGKRNQYIGISSSLIFIFKFLGMRK